MSGTPAQIITAPAPAPPPSSDPTADVLMFIGRFSTNGHGYLFTGRRERP